MFLKTELLDEFMVNASVRRYEEPTVAEDQVLLRCAKIVNEESLELVEALGFREDSGSIIREHAMPSLRHVLKEAIDNMYVTLYTLKALGFSEQMIQKAWDLVAINNNAKFGEGSTKRPGDGKVIPPPGFVKEDLRSLLP